MSDDDLARLALDAVKLADDGPTAGDVDNAHRWLQLHGDRFRYHAAARRWLAYHGGVWLEDDDRCAARLAAEQVARRLLLEASAAGDGDDAKAAAKQAMQAMQQRRLLAMIDVAAPHVTVTADDLDADPWLLGTANGIVDLRTGDLHDHDPAALLTRQTAASYDPDAPATDWHRFLERIMPDPDLRAFLQRLVGYGLVGEQREHVLPIAYGTGANGKSTLFGALGAALGTYAGKIAVGQLIGRSGTPTGATPELLTLRGRRLVVADEPEAGAHLREAQVKALTGGDRIVARPLYGAPVEFTPSHSLWIITNHRPAVEGTDEGIWRRLLLIPFTVSVPTDEQDPDLPAKLSAEADGLLAWSVAGCLAWQQRGLDPPDTVTRATAEWRGESDHLAGFIEDRCITSASVSCRAGDLYDAYVEWCRDAGVEPATATAFGRSLTDRGYPPGRSRRTRSRVGIALAGKDGDGL